jgi:CubicO group peptidase (beta-lactamase class C family)
MKIALLSVLLVALFTVPATTASAPTARPEDVGMSSERLQRVTQMIDRRIAAGELAGAVVIVARKGSVVLHEARGVMDLDSKQPCPQARCSVSPP